MDTTKAETKPATGSATQTDASRTVAEDPRSPKRPKPPHGAADIRDHELIRRIGQGAYGEVWLARNVMGTYRAVKIVCRAGFECASRFSCMMIDLRIPASCSVPSHEPPV